MNPQKQILELIRSLNVAPLADGLDAKQIADLAKCQWDAVQAMNFTSDESDQVKRLMQQIYEHQEIGLKTAQLLAGSRKEVEDLKTDLKELVESVQALFGYYGVRGTMSSSDPGFLWDKPISRTHMGRLTESLARVRR